MKLKDNESYGLDDPIFLFSVMTLGVCDKCYKLQALNPILLLWGQFKLPPLWRASPACNRVMALVPG